MKRYLFFATLHYAYSILRPLEQEIWRRGDDVAWFIEDTCPVSLLPGEKQLKTIDEAISYNPIAVFAPGNYIYHFLPGVKVAVFHGYPMRKRIEKIDDHFTIRGWFDIYCTQGPSSTPYFQQLAQRHGFFRIYETGWCKMDPFFSPDLPPEPKRQQPVVLYSPTFTRGISSAWDLLPTIDRLATEKPWQWIITFHPKLNDPTLISDYEQLAQRHPNVTFTRVNKGLETFRQTDVMLCDSSSITLEYMMLGKPVVTFRNTHPGPHLIDVREEHLVAPAIEEALTRPAHLMQAISDYTAYHEAHRDGHNAARVLDAVDDFIANHQGHLRRKPLNLFRKLKLRLKLHYWKHLF